VIGSNHDRALGGAVIEEPAEASILTVRSRQPIMFLRMPGVASVGIDALL